MAFAFSIGSVPTAARATWSVVGTDPLTREVGIAGASCVSGVEGIAGVLPNHGAVAAQARFNQRGIDRALVLMGEGKTPREIIQGVTDPAFAPNFDVLQFGVVTLDTPPAGFTGANATSWAGDVQGPYASVQGNILVGENVVKAGLAAFEANLAACPVTLADRLMAGLEAGSAAGGDRRCSGTPSETALSAFVIVALPTDTTSSLELVITGPVRNANPVAQLRQRYDAWRAAHPPDASRCLDAGTRDTDARVDAPMLDAMVARPDGRTEAGAGGAAGAGSGSAGGSAGASGLDASGGGSPATGSSSTGSSTAAGTAAGTGTAGTGASATTGTRGPEMPTASAGCDCRLKRRRIERPPMHGWWLASVALLRLARRRTSVTCSGRRNAGA